MLLNDEKLRALMKENALQRVNSIFTWRNVCDQLSDLYMNVAGSAYALKNIHYNIKKAV